MREQVADPTKIEAGSIAMKDLCPRRGLITHDHSADGALGSRQWVCVDPLPSASACLLLAGRAAHQHRSAEN